MINHKAFLKWLLYAVLIIFSMGALVFNHIPQKVLQFDHLYLSVILTLIYFAAEIVTGLSIFGLDKQHSKVTEVLKFLKNNPLITSLKIIDDRVFITASNNSMTVQTGILNSHIMNLIIQAENGKVNQVLLLDTLIDEQYFKNSLNEFLAGQIVWFGILGTVLGVIMSFWPLLLLGKVDVEAIKAYLPDFMKGMAVAFVPTAMSFVFKMILDIGNKIAKTSISECSSDITVITETYIIPFLEKTNAKT